VLDADIRSCFDTLDQGWPRKFIEHRIADQRVVRSTLKWLGAGVLEDGKRMAGEVGTVQGKSISPLPASVCLRYVFDVWVRPWRRKEARGDAVVVRLLDDFAVEFQHRDEAEWFLNELCARCARFGLELLPEKTRLLDPVPKQGSYLRSALPPCNRICLLLRFRVTERYMSRGRLKSRGVKSRPCISPVRRAFPMMRRICGRS